MVIVNKIKMSVIYFEILWVVQLILAKNAILAIKQYSINCQP